MKRWLKRISIILLVLLITSTTGFVIWSLNPLEAMPEAVAAIKSDDEVLVNNEEWMVFNPIHTKANTGVIIYPGGHVDPRAYAPLAKEIARAGSGFRKKSQKGAFRRASSHFLARRR